MYQRLGQARYQFGDFQQDLTLGILTRRNERVPLGSKAFEVLACLLSRAGEVVTKADLFAAVWPDSFVEEGALSQQIFTLRKALGDKADYIATVPGQGYRFTGEVRSIPPNPSATSAAGWDTIVHETRETSRVLLEEPILPMVPAAVAPMLRSPRAWPVKCVCVPTDK